MGRTGRPSYGVTRLTLAALEKKKGGGEEEKKVGMWEGIAWDSWMSSGILDDGGGGGGGDNRKGGAH